MKKVKLYLLLGSIITEIFFQPDRLVANDFIQCRKVAEHILEKLLGDGTASSPGGGDADSTPSNNGYNVDQIELTCNEQVKNLSFFQGIVLFQGTEY